MVYSWHEFAIATFWVTSFFMHVFEFYLRRNKTLAWPTITPGSYFSLTCRFEFPFLCPFLYFSQNERLYWLFSSSSSLGKGLLYLLPSTLHVVEKQPSKTTAEAEAAAIGARTQAAAAFETSVTERPLFGLVSLATTSSWRSSSSSSRCVGSVRWRKARLFPLFVLDWVRSSRQAGKAMYGSWYYKVQLGTDRDRKRPSEKKGRTGRLGRSKLTRLDCRQDGRREGAWEWKPS